MKIQIHKKNMTFLPEIKHSTFRDYCIGQQVHRRKPIDEMAQVN